MAHAVNNRYVAHLGAPDVLGDGAEWIWNQAALHFGRSHQVLDWYHAKEHLIAAARLRKQAGTAAFTRWLNSRETLLYQGHAVKIADELDKAARQYPANAQPLSTAAGYFHNNQHRMNYIELRKGSWPIGSGVVESGAKQFKTRFCGPGMHWSRKGAENLLPIRAAVLGARFDPMWAAVQNSPPV